MDGAWWSAVRLEVDGFALDSNSVPEFDTVTVEGRAARARPDDVPAGSGVEVWPDGVATTVISIPIASINGTAERLPQGDGVGPAAITLDDGPPASAASGND